MNTILAISGALGGFVAFALAVATIVRAIARQIAASKSNETATLANTEALGKLSGKLDQIDGTVTRHGERIARLEGSGYGPRK
jgi:hypothetical protein